LKRGAVSTGIPFSYFPSAKKNENMKAHYLLIFSALFTTQAVLAQDDCPVVIAGPAIHVCADNGSVTFSPYVEGKYSELIWTGGKGKFTPSVNDADAEYTPDPSEAGQDIKLTLTAKAKTKTCTDAVSEVIIHVDQTPVISAGGKIRLTEGQLLQLKPVVSVYDSISWTSNGSGTFDNANKLNATYTPSETDLKKKAFSLELYVKNGACPGVTDIVTVLIVTAEKKIEH
jgi:hypothetical protein